MKLVDHDLAIEWAFKLEREFKYMTMTMSVEDPNFDSHKWVLQSTLYPDNFRNHFQIFCNSFELTYPLSRIHTIGIQEEIFWHTLKAAREMKRAMHKVLICGYATCSLQPFRLIPIMNDWYIEAK